MQGVEDTASIWTLIYHDQAIGAVKEGGGGVMGWCEWLEMLLFVLRVDVHWLRRC